MKHTSNDRRKNRSDNVYKALQYQLLYSAKRAKFDAFVLADQEGFVVAQTGSEEVCEELAALSPILCSASNSWYGFVDTKVGKTLLSVEPCPIEGRQLFLTATVNGSSSEVLTKEMAISNSGVHRILH